MTFGFCLCLLFLIICPSFLLEFFTPKTHPTMNYAWSGTKQSHLELDIMSNVISYMLILAFFFLFITFTLLHFWSFDLHRSCLGWKQNHNYEWTGTTVITYLVILSRQWNMVNKWLCEKWLWCSNNPDGFFDWPTAYWQTGFCCLLKRFANFSLAVF